MGSRRMLVLGGSCLAGAVLAVVVLSFSLDGSTPSNTAGMSSQELADEKLRQEIQELATANARAGGIERLARDWTPTLTALAAIAAVGATLWKQSSDLRAVREQSQADHRAANEAAAQAQHQLIDARRREADEREAESLRRFDANLATVIANLGGGSETLQVNAAAALGTYLRPRYASFHRDLLTVVAANLRLRPSPEVARAFVADLERLLQLMSAGSAEYDDLPSRLDLARSSLARLDISGLDLSWILLDVAFADMTAARLEGASLFRLRGREVVLERAHVSRADLREARLDGASCAGASFHGTNLVSASLKKANLTGAQFQEASLQEAHLEGSTLLHANFTGADVANAYFSGAVFDPVTVRSIARGAKRWRENRNFDPPVRAALEEAGA